MANRRNDRKPERRKFAESLKAARAARSPQHQWDHLDANLGVDKGAMLERAKLYLAMDAEESA